MSPRIAFVFTLLASLLIPAGCVTDYALVAPEKIVYVEVPVEVEIEPEDTGPPEELEYGDVWVDHFYQSAVMDGIDILWVIDTSGSMNVHKPTLISGIGQMMTSLNSLGVTTQWRLALMAADGTAASTEAQFPLIYGDDAADAEDMYDNMNTGHREEGFDASYEYLINNSYANTWMRNDAALLVVFVSDEKEQGSMFSDGLDYVLWLGSIGRPQVFVASIVNLEPDDSLCNYSSVNSGLEYIAAATALSGVVVDICSEDWTAGVNDATNQLEPVLEYELSHKPIEETVEVFVDGHLYDPSLWYYDASINHIIFLETDPATGELVGPPPSSLVEIGYMIESS